MMHRGLAFCLALALALGAAPQIKAVEAPAANATSADAAPATDSAAGEAARLARMQGSAESAVVDWVLANSGPLEGDGRAGPFRVAYTITPAEGWWEMAAGGTLAWHEPPANAVHLRVFVLDRNNGRVVNGLTLAVTLVDGYGNEQAAPVAFGWYPLINAYGGNVSLSADGRYRLRVSIVAPATRSTPLSAGEEKVQSDSPARVTTIEFPAVDIAQNEVMLLPLATNTGFATEAKLLKPGNDALSAAITALWRQSITGAEQPSGDYFVAYALGDATASNTLAMLRRKGRLDFGSRENTSLEVLVRDSRTGRPIPSLMPLAQLVAADGNPFDNGELTPLRRPWLNVYGRNLRIARKASYKLRVWFEAPGFRRWGRQSERFAQPAEVEFEDLSLRPEAKPESKTP